MNALVVSGGLALVAVAGCSQQSAERTPPRVVDSTAGQAHLLRVACDMNGSPRDATSEQLDAAEELPSSSRIVQLFWPNLELKVAVAGGKSKATEWRKVISPLYSISGDERLLGPTPDVLNVERDDVGAGQQASQVRVSWTSPNGQLFRFDVGFADVPGSWAHLSRWNNSKATKPDFILWGTCAERDSFLNSRTKAAS